MGRGAYAAWLLGTIGVTAALIIGGLLAFYGFGNRSSHHFLEDIWVFAILPVAVWIVTVLLIRRLHDMDCAGWHVLWIWLVSIAGVISGGGFWSIPALLMHGFLMVNPGRPEPNRFGRSPGG